METQDKTSSTSQISWLTKSSKFKGKTPVEQLFDKLDALYPTKWKMQFKSALDLENWHQCWGEELDGFGVTFTEATEGLKKIIRVHRDWPPTFPQFLEACRPSVDPEAAFYEAVKQMQLREKGRDEWSSPVVYWAAVILGRDLMSYSYSQVKVRWEYALEEAKNDISEGKRSNEVPPRLKRLTEPQKPVRQGMSEVAEREFAKTKEIFNTKPKWQREYEERTGRTYKDPNFKTPGQCVAEAERKRDAA